MNENARHLRVDIQHYWHPGTGRGAGRSLDAVAHRDHRGLPCLPGRHLKGLLRDALERAEEWRWPGYDGLAARLFGDRPVAGNPALPEPGCLRVSDARLPEDFAAWLVAPENRRHIVALFRALSATAIDRESGTALDRSLRTIEVVVPLCLTATVEVLPGHEAPSDWHERLDEVLPLIQAVGAHRHRGLGRAVLTLHPAGGA